MDIDDKILIFSRATAVVLLPIYLIYLYFQLGSHKSLFLDGHDGVSSAAAHATGDEEKHANGAGADDDEKDGGGQQTSLGQLVTAVVVLLVSAAGIMKCTQHIIESLDETARLANVSKTFIATILIPYASNASELSTVVTAARTRRVSNTIGVIIGSILQVALFVLPVLVVAGCALGRPMTLYFQTSQTFILFLAILMVNQVLSDGRYTYLHGVMLLSL